MKIAILVIPGLLVLWALIAAWVVFSALKMGRKKPKDQPLERFRRLSRRLEPPEEPVEEPPIVFPDVGLFGSCSGCNKVSDDLAECGDGQDGPIRLCKSCHQLFKGQ